MQYLSTGMESIIISPDLTILGKESKQFNAEPSDRIYFGRYPYKIKLDFNDDISHAVEAFFIDNAEVQYLPGMSRPEFYSEIAHQDLAITETWEERWARQSRRWLEMSKLKDMILQLDLFEMERFYCNVHEGHISVYVRTKKHYNKILKALPQHVMLVQGPWNKKHKDLLLDPEQTMVVRKKPYWGKYDIRIEIQPRGSRYNRWSGHVKRRELMNDALLFIQDSIEEGAVRISNKRYWYGVMWTNDKDLAPVIPFLNIAYPNLKLHTYRCFYFK